MKADIVKKAFEESAALFQLLAKEHTQFVIDAASLVENCLRENGRFFTCGNGGSAADAQHVACELSGKFYLNRPGLAAVALTVNTSALTAIGNDFSYEEVFSRQLEGLAQPGDVLLGITTSGGSANVVHAMKKAKAMGLKTIGLTGARGNKFAELCDLCLVVPNADTPRIQEAHIAAGHMICQLVEEALFGDSE